MSLLEGASVFCGMVCLWWEGDEGREGERGETKGER